MLELPDPAREAVTALAAVASDDLVYIGVDVDPNEQVDALAAYAEEQGFDWMFAVASKDVARSLAGREETTVADRPEGLPGCRWGRRAAGASQRSPPGSA